MRTLILNLIFRSKIFFRVGILNFRYTSGLNFDLFLYRNTSNNIIIYYHSIRLKIFNYKKHCFISTGNYLRKIFSKLLIDFKVMSIVR